MGQAAAGVLGAALGSGRKAVAIVGDGAMLMQSEISTAVQYALPVVWVVLNDGRYGMTERGMILEGLRPAGTSIPQVDFVAFAKSLGATGERVTSENELEAALFRALSHTGPFVVDVLIDPTESAPIGQRIAMLQGEP
jgi:acetolactate synthase-1/2/3 large subunit